MPVTFNLRHLEKKDLRLQGELPPAELDAADLDELIDLRQPLQYDLTLEPLPGTVLVRGRLSLVLNCECARCLKPFETRVEIDPWNCNLPLEGEEKVKVEDDCVDLTPFIREDTLLAFPQYPLCEPECSGLPGAPLTQSQLASGANQAGEVLSAWAELNKLKL